MTHGSQWDWYVKGSLAPCPPWIFGMMRNMRCATYYLHTYIFYLNLVSTLYVHLVYESLSMFLKFPVVIFFQKLFFLLT